MDRRGLPRSRVEQTDPQPTRDATPCRAVLLRGNQRISDSAQEEYQDDQDQQYKPQASSSPHRSIAIPKALGRSP